MKYLLNINKPIALRHCDISFIAHRWIIIVLSTLLSKQQLQSIGQLLTITAITHNYLSRNLNKKKRLRLDIDLIPKVSLL